ncbi:GNAT family N-acetyltransferase [Nocardioides mangrovi]|uniref:GNAT family N-acetyltransferase n=1 Tax=Nocardioides mangrovi TaxID=2874580 RepID=A0ABS7UCJ7_9ACTN|nr:GNAT family N-acetyltransferase [Nocardioides mangrovi]MBZ5738607.1 GNAT family N-acetyltransferase [Nocardioides mangrovi]
MVTISTDPALLDVDRVHRWLSTDAYWALGRHRDVLERAIAGSLCFGAYDESGQVGFCRLVTDRATFAWLCDVYIDPATRGRGVGISLMEAVDRELAGMQVGRAVLATADAHGLYARFGFAVMDQPERWMLRRYDSPSSG